jgi:hypothetical protein
MSEKKNPSPAVIVTMVAGIILVGGFAVKSAIDSSVPEPVKLLPASGSGVSATSANGQPTTSGAVLPDRTGQTSDRQNVALATPGEADSDSEAGLAPNGDPFVALAVSSTPQKPVVTGGAQASGQPPISGGAAMGLGAPPRGSLPGAFPGGTVVLPMKVDAPRPEAPELVGTMLGDTPMAVFRSQEHLQTVPQGGSFMGWKVLSVRHGEVVVRNGQRTERLGVGWSRRGTIVSGSLIPSHPENLAAQPPAPDPAPESRTALQVVSDSEPNSITRDLAPDALPMGTGAPTAPQQPAAPADPTVPAVPTSPARGGSEEKPAGSDSPLPAAPPPAIPPADEPVRKP